MKRVALLFVSFAILASCATSGVKAKVVEEWIFSGDSLVGYSNNEFFVVFAQEDITIYSQTTQQLSVVEVLEKTEAWTKWLCLDNDGTRCHVMIVTRDGNEYLTVAYSDCEFVYRYTALS